jgi:hypothetical protein
LNQEFKRQQSLRFNTQTRLKFLYNFLCQISPQGCRIGIYFQSQKWLLQRELSFPLLNKNSVQKWTGPLIDKI